jgi:hypothetical protein
MTIYDIENNNVNLISLRMLGQSMGSELSDIRVFGHVSVEENFLVSTIVAKSIL